MHDIGEHMSELEGMIRGSEPVVLIDMAKLQGPEGFFSLLLLGRTRDGWDWRKRGVCIFLGGDQFYTVCNTSFICLFMLI